MINNKMRLVSLVMVAIGTVAIVVFLVLFLPFEIPRSDKEQAPTSSFDPELLREPHQSEYEFITRNLEKIIDGADVDGAMELVMEGFSNGKLDAFECHSLTHEIGHHAAAPDHFEHIVGHAKAEFINFCGAGFMHGVEDGLASSKSSDFREQLYYFCGLVKPIATTYSNCYHGAGHAFLKLYPSPNDAIKECELLITDKNIDSSACIRGVYSQYLADQKKEGKKNQELLAYCASQPSSNWALCGLELNGFGINTSSSTLDINNAFLDCYQNKFDLILKIACVQSVSWVATDKYLSVGEDVEVPRSIGLLPQELRHAYIAATMHEMKRHIRDGGGVDSISLCEQLSKKEDEDYCKNLLQEWSQEA